MDVSEAVEEVSIQLNLTLKENQRDAIVGFCSGNDVFVSLPTGYGKSLIFAVLPLVFDKIRGRLYR